MTQLLKAPPAKVRIDKWLWAVRLFKTRSLASAACDEGKVSIDGISAKASKTLKGGEMIEVKNKGITYQYKVKALLEQRVGAALVISYCEDLTTEEEKEKEKLRTAFVYFTGKRHTKVGRPTKKDARNREKFLDEIKEEQEEGEN
jgi:ribosome-associated heat shock protein Hsp15